MKSTRDARGTLRSKNRRRGRARMPSATPYLRMSAAYRSYVEDFPEGAFPTFLEALLLEDHPPSP
jgi:hypothetical protein